MMVCFVAAKIKKTAQIERFFMFSEIFRLGFGRSFSFSGGSFGSFLGSSLSCGFGFSSLLGFHLGEFALGNLGGAGLVDLLLSLDARLLLATGFLFVSLHDVGVAGFLLLHPVLELDFGLFLSHSAFLHATHQVILHHDAGFAEQRASRVGRLSADAVPIQSSVKLDADLSWIGERVVGA